ncbi:MAG: ABC transporter ATP-binding protein [Clostridium perfringens]|nr:ABC transporter ATP-binding protein [Clostridium perfringens]
MLKVKNLSVSVKNGKTISKIIDNISFDIEKNKCLGILGESGSGKSITCKAILGLLDKNFSVEGEAIFQGENILTLNEEEKRKLRGNKISMIVQNPMTAFNPLYTVGNQVIETFREHMKISKGEAKILAISSFEKMNLKNPKEVLKKYPHELSGGMLQRIMIGITIFLEPDLIVADEPTTAIDSLNQREVIKEFLKMKEELKTSMIFITHDLSVLSEVADNIIVMNKGEIIEYGTKKEIILNPQNSHTKFLVDTRLKLLRRFKEVVN